MCSLVVNLFLLRCGCRVTKELVTLLIFLQICNMLKKKHEEAKEIMVRAIVTNNSLLMLNHPMFDEKISFFFFGVTGTIFVFLALTLLLEGSFVFLYN